MNNTIILKKGEERFTKNEYEQFQKGDTIWGDGAFPEELKRWPIEEIDEAKEELKNYKCEYTKDIALYNVTEDALEYCECDENGDFVQGANYDLAPEKEGLKIKTYNSNWEIFLDGERVMSISTDADSINPDLYDSTDDIAEAIIEDLNTNGDYLSEQDEYEIETLCEIHFSHWF